MRIPNIAAALFVIVPLLVVGEYLAATKHGPAVASASGRVRVSQLRTSKKLGNCPLNKIREGMQLSEVRAKLGTISMQYRGVLDNQKAYFVDAGACSATVAFDQDEVRVTSISFAPGSADAVMPSEEAQNTGLKEAGLKEPELQEGKAAQAPAMTPSDIHRTRLPEIIWVDAYVKANSGSDNLDNVQLAKLAHSEFASHQASYPAGMTLSDDFATDRAKRAATFIEAHLQSFQTGPS